MSVSLAEDRRAWGSLPGEVHRILVEEYERTGVSPPASMIAEKMGSDPPSISRILKQLMAEGLIAQPHGPRSGYIPLCRPDGTQVRPVLVEVKAGKAETPDPIQADKSVTELLREALKKAEKLEGQ